MLQIDVECLPGQIGQFFSESTELALLFKFLDGEVFLLLFEGGNKCLFGFYIISLLDLVVVLFHDLHVHVLYILLNPLEIVLDGSYLTFILIEFELVVVLDGLHIFSIL